MYAMRGVPVRGVAFKSMHKWRLNFFSGVFISGAGGVGGGAADVVV